MPLDFRNVNLLWSSLIVETLVKLGLENVVICPGSRSSPLTVAFAENRGINCIPILDERSASFFALGLAKKNQKPAALVCTSGTAGANFFPAVIEAKYSHVPLIIFTADRPSTLRNCHAGQTINQVGLYGNYPSWQVELSEPSWELDKLFYLRQNIIYAWEKSQFPSGGVVHINVPFPEPLSPELQLEISPKKREYINEKLLSSFPNIPTQYHYSSENLEAYLNTWKQTEKGIIIAGVDTHPSPGLYVKTVKFLSDILRFPVLSEALSPVRNYAHLNPHLVTNYDVILRHPKYAQDLLPHLVILFGEYPTSKQLRIWLESNKISTYIITESDDNFDALHSPSQHIRIRLETLCCFLEASQNQLKENWHYLKNSYLKTWLTLDKRLGITIGNQLRQIEETGEIFEGSIAFLMSQYLPPKTPVFIANSMPVRYAEFFWQKNNREYRVYFNRGANGIDGTLSTALGIAYKEKKTTVLLTGDLALLHDTNGFLITPNFQGCLVILLVNNNGGGIFEMLPIGQYKQDVFENYFATPQSVNFQHLSQSYNINYKSISTLEHLRELLSNLPQNGIHLWEIKTDRKKDARRLKNILSPEETHKNN
ncbi:MAG: 2-succinyl-5-enolpyruvyl-6-hydroxy-3-cyclohexene-1-carboxylic-acid synthase [Geminocystis sp.]|nr:2-succinyl-5-enolpyruvyl-6-hydroxy-3-cyclohexene-1-carboxylic-acid synthase [Geminocystis sp.]MCS7147776.1 2-succinyl-5-enolpyruvyl-6-hydroxy-3-cyclohexene-1-carboxylic-acid synthase [Geminocystis sp.]MDW8116650.1 2-succinyl-5-enolpyruvyl-6-hydroxy-3-cyclohexene-1-carboxylic-acid synthase [Geminocystis sp.]MDW8463944.1 2-succinyl-5-enolpyruvyl-6-hydroxy-3-cyclohexene-1-carboxylic-acid synthase [Geminocystis sp.]